MADIYKARISWRRPRLRRVGHIDPEAIPHTTSPTVPISLPSTDWDRIPQPLSHSRNEPRYISISATRSHQLPIQRLTDRQSSHNYLSEGTPERFDLNDCAAGDSRLSLSIRYAPGNGDISIQSFHSFQGCAI